MQYDFKKVNLILASSGYTYVVTGFANNSNIDAEYKNDAYTVHVGAKGGDDVAYAVNNDRSGTIKFKLMDTSPSCAILMRLYRNRVNFSTSIVDGNDTTKSTVKSSNCVIEKPGTYSRGNDVQGQEWTIGCPDLDIEYENEPEI